MEVPSAVASGPLSGPVPVAASVQVPPPAKMPSPLGFAAKSTVPVGVLTVPESVSVTVALQVVAAPAFTGAQETAVVVERVVTVIPNGLELEVECVLSPW